MNVHPGGAQPKMWDTYYNCRVQRMVLRDGITKGIELVLEVKVGRYMGENFRACMTLNMRKLKYSTQRPCK